MLFRPKLIFDLYIIRTPKVLVTNKISLYFEIMPISFDTSRLITS